MIRGTVNSGNITGEIFIKWDETEDEEWLLLIYIKNNNGYNIKSTGFFVAGESSPVYITDIPNADGQTGVLSIVKPIDNGDVLL